MKKNKLIIILLLLVVIIGGGIFLFNWKKTAPEATNTTINLELGQEIYINQQEKVTINGSQDYIIITKKVKKDDSEKKEGEANTIIEIPYTIHVNGVDFHGTYLFGTILQTKLDNNTKYEVLFKDLTSDYKTGVIIYAR